MDTTFTAALLANSQGLEATQIPTTDEWISNMWSIHTMEYYLCLKKQGNSGICYNMDEPSDIMCSEISRRHRILLTRIPGADKFRHRDKRVAARGWRRRSDIQCLLSIESQFGKRKKFWRWTWGRLHMDVSTLTATELHT